MLFRNLVCCFKISNCQYCQVSAPLTVPNAKTKHRSPFLLTLHFPEAPVVDRSYVCRKGSAHPLVHSVVCKVQQQMFHTTLDKREKWQRKRSKSKKGAVCSNKEWWKLASSSFVSNQTFSFAYCMSSVCVCEHALWGGSLHTTTTCYFLVNASVIFFLQHAPKQLKWDVNHTEQWHHSAVQ